MQNNKIPILREVNKIAQSYKVSCESTVEVSPVCWFSKSMLLMSS